MPSTTLSSLLQNLGLTEKEAQVYLAIQKHGRIPPSELAVVTGINRTTVYSVAKELLAKGVIVEDLGSSTRELLATAPEELNRFLERQLAEVKEKQTIVDEAIEMVRAVAGEATYPVPKIQFIKEDRMTAFLYDRTPEWDRSLMEVDGTYLGFQEQAFVEKYADWIEWYWTRHPKGMKFNLLSNNSEAEQRVASVVTPDRRITFWKENVKFTATTWVMGDYVVMFVLSSSPNYLVEIHDARFAQNQRALFKAILEDIDARQAR